MDVLIEMRKIAPNLRAIMLTDYADVESAVKSMKLGALDYLSKGTSDLPATLKLRIDDPNNRVREFASQALEADDGSPEGPISMMLDAGQLVANFQSSQIHFALHGHQHVPFVGTTARACQSGNTWGGYDKPLTIIGCGSSGASVNRLADVIRDNSLGIYTPRGKFFEVRVERFNPTIDPETYMKISLRL
ncbi:MAG TPA: hypothetical protein VKB86_13530 [Pyrinomonadaceae bacterium]|nr:hypothetical protein [Pyrinomonadaceae bacterium]